MTDHYAYGVKPPSLAELQARNAIVEVLSRYVRGVDRLDMALVRSCFHPGGRDVRPPLFEGSIDEYVAWVTPTLKGMEQTTHMLGNTLFSFQSETEATTETYYLALLKSRRDGKLFMATRAGRYLDSLSFKNGAWALDVRRSVTDSSRIDALDGTQDPSLLTNFMQNQRPGAAPLIGSRDRADASYALL
jgi:hypothetical protein